MCTKMHVKLLKMPILCYLHCKQIQKKNQIKLWLEKLDYEHKLENLSTLSDTWGWYILLIGCSYEMLLFQ